MTLQMALSVSCPVLCFLSSPLPIYSTCLNLPLSLCNYMSIFLFFRGPPLPPILYSIPNLCGYINCSMPIKGLKLISASKRIMLYLSFCVCVNSLRMVQLHF